MLQPRKRSVAARHALANAGTSLDCGNAGQESQYGALSQASLGLEGLRNGMLGSSEPSCCLTDRMPGSLVCTPPRSLDYITEYHLGLFEYSPSMGSSND